MKSVRIFYTKGGRLRFVSHLDMTRFFSRILRRAEIPIWYTEGFHPHPYITFALPLSLGFESTDEIMDLKLTDDDYPFSRLVSRLNEVVPPDLHVFDAAEPVLKTGKIGAARFSVAFDDGRALAEPLTQFLSRGEILCTKTNKRGEEKPFDLIPKLIAHETVCENGQTVLRMTLPAGGRDNVNPALVTDTFFTEFPEKLCPLLVTRTAILDENGALFR